MSETQIDEINLRFESRDSIRDDLSYYFESSESESETESNVYRGNEDSILTPYVSDLKLSPVDDQEVVDSLFEDEELFYPDIFDAEIDETEIFILDGSVVTAGERYEMECKKYMLPPITRVTKALDGSKHINLARYMPSTVHMHIIFEAISLMPRGTITHLDLSYNNFKPDACNMLADLLRQSNTLIYLNLKQCRIGPKGAEILADGIERAQSVMHLNLSGCALQDEGGALIVAAVAGNEVLKALNLSRNFLHVNTAIGIEVLLKENKTLQALNVKWNDLYPEKESSVKIMKALRKNIGLKFLDLSWNGICGKRFAGALRNVMVSNKVLTKLMLSNNILSTVEIGSICSGILKTKTLRELHVGGNRFTLEDIQQLIYALAINPTITTLNLGEHTYLTGELYQKAIYFNKMIKAKYLNVDGIIFGGKLLPNPPQQVDFRALIIDRAKFLAMKPKSQKMKRDMGHFMYKLLEHPDEYIKEEDFWSLLIEFKAKLDDDLILHLIQEFRERIKVGRVKRKRTPIKKMAEYYLARHFTEPPPPPPEKKPKKQKEKKEGNEQKEKEKGKEKGKGKGKGKGKKK